MAKKRLCFVIIAVVLTAAFVSICFLLAPIVIYPQKYNDFVRQYCQKYNVDEALVYAVINTESHFDTNALSNAGARGLMQLMPLTAQWLADKAGIEQYSIDLLFDPETNIKLGTFYLAYLEQKFCDLEIVAAAYNAGEGTVSVWLNDPDIFVDGKLKNIPYAETKGYIKKICRAYKVYNKRIN